MDVITVPDVAKMLNLSQITVYRLAKLGKIPAKKIGRCWRFSKQTIEEWFTLKHSWEEDMDNLLIDMQTFAKQKNITENDIQKAIKEVRQTYA